MKANTVKILTLSIMFFIASCNESALYKESVVADNVAITDEYEAIEAEQITKETGSTILESPYQLKIIKSAKARYKVENIAKSLEKIKGIASNKGAYISDLRYTNDLYKKENRFTIKVPKAHFDGVMDSIKTVVDFVDYENITTKDVTEEFIDIETRLKTKLEVKKRYEAILRTNAKTVEDILKTEDKLRLLQEEIESAQGRLNYLSNRVSFSTIQIDLYERVDYVEEPSSYSKSFWTKLKGSLSDGLHMIEALLLLLLRIWPLLILGTIGYILLKKLFKK